MIVLLDSHLGHVLVLFLHSLFRILFLQIHLQLLEFLCSLLVKYTFYQLGLCIFHLLDVLQLLYLQALFLVLLLQLLRIYLLLLLCILYAIGVLVLLHTQLLHLKLMYGNMDTSLSFFYLYRLVLYHIIF